MSALSSLLGFGGVRSGPSRSYSDVVLVFGVVAIIALMILPLPSPVIDFLVAVNILVGIGLLLIAIYIPSPVAFSSFPSVLLLTTLFRLALAIAITRSILLRADAGHIINTFGNMVVGGNLIVGLVVFLIITVVQFIVVAKGAERVAEVAARFSLDAMPGKQLSIDSDLRSGIIDKDETKRRRRYLEVESQLYGSLDGAMKFVKGDAICGIVIIIINLLGGLAIGVLQRGLTLADATHTYSILTIGDGLVAQIPALLGAISAGLVVTRTADVDGEGGHLAAAISKQIARQPRVILIAGVIAFGMMLVPGFPTLVFLLLSLMCLSTAAWQMRTKVGILRRVFKLPEIDAELLQRQPGDSDALAAPAALLLEVEPIALQALGHANVRAILRETVAAVRDEYGIPLPPPAMRVDPKLPENAYRLVAHGVRIGVGTLRADARFLPAPKTTALALPNPAGSEEPEFSPAFPGEWETDLAVSQQDAAIGAHEVLRRHLRQALEQHLSLFIGIQETSDLCNRLSRDYPDLVREMLRVVSPQRIADVLKRLVDERIPVRHLRDVFEAITDAAGREKDPVLVSEYVRIAMRRHISERYAGPGRVLYVLIAHPELEDRLRRSVHVGASGAQLAIEPELAARLLEQIRDKLADAPPDHTSMLCSMDVRRHLRKLTEMEFAEIPVLSYQELVPELKLVPVAQLAA